MTEFFLRIIVRLIARMPFFAVRGLGRQVGRLLYWSRSRLVRTTRRNLEHCELPLSATEKSQIAYQSCLHTGCVVMESIWIWQQPYCRVQPLIQSIEGQSLIDEAFSKKRGLVLIGAHIGNWEVFSLWLGQHYPCVGMYRPAKFPFLDQLIRAGRSRTGMQLISGERKNARALLQALHQNKAFALLSDQEPQQGSGVYAPFFGKPAYTMTLPQKLAQKTTADILFFQVVRTPKGFVIKVSKPKDALDTSDGVAFCKGMNQHLTDMIMENPEQFEWGYKRFKSPPDGDYDFYPE